MAHILNAAVSVRLSKLLANNKSLSTEVCKVLTFQKILKALTYRYLQIISNKGKALRQTKNTYRKRKWTKQKKRLITLARVCQGKHK